MPAKMGGGSGRADFLNAQKSAAIAETIKKEERVLYRMLEKQIELGRIVLPDEPEAGDSCGGAAASGGGAHNAAVERHMTWLLAAHRGSAGGADAGTDAAAAAGQGQGQDAAAGQANQRVAGSVDPEEEARLRAQMRTISATLWSSLSSGMASGSVAYSSGQSKADYGYSQAAVAAMQSAGELDTQHHRRRDSHSAYMEASARDAALRRGSLPGKPAARGS